MNVTLALFGLELLYIKQIEQKSSNRLNRGNF